MTSTERIREFWQWFSSVANQFGERFENRALIDELDARIADLGKFCWELGPGVRVRDTNALVLTPCGDPVLLNETKRVVAAAPDCPGWEFYPAKPPKEWQRRFVIHGPNGRQFDVDASGCRYVLFEYPDGIFDIVIAEPNVAALPEGLREEAVIILLDGELGEEQRMSLIVDSEVVAAFEDELFHKSSRIESLSAHLHELGKGTGGEQLGSERQGGTDDSG